MAASTSITEIRPHGTGGFVFGSLDIFITQSADHTIQIMIIIQMHRSRGKMFGHERLIVIASRPSGTVILIQEVSTWFGLVILLFFLKPHLTSLFVTSPSWLMSSLCRRSRTSTTFLYNTASSPRTTTGILGSSALYCRSLLSSSSMETG